MIEAKIKWPCDNQVGLFARERQFEKLSCGLYREVSTGRIFHENWLVDKKVLNILDNNIKSSKMIA